MQVARPQRTWGLKAKVIPRPWAHGEQGPAHTPHLQADPMSFQWRHHRRHIAGHQRMAPAEERLSMF